MIYVTGDMHQLIDFQKIAVFAGSEEAEKLTKEDYLIVCGDFGLLWNWLETGNAAGLDPSDTKWNRDEISLKEFLDEMTFTTLFVDGNHENHARLNGYPVTQWNGGKVHKITDSIIHLMRGQVFEIDGKKIFTFGGAESTDRGPATGTRFLDEGTCWWPEELCNQQERDEALENLKKVDNKVDYIITHCLSDKQELRRGSRSMNVQTAFLWNVEDTVEFKTWFCGHYHEDAWVTDKIRILYDDVVPIEAKSPTDYVKEE